MPNTRVSTINVSSVRLYIIFANMDAWQNNIGGYLRRTQSNYNDQILKSTNFRFYSSS
jgi:hypothetical protein